MTLRELINHVLDRGKFQKTIGYIHNTDSRWREEAVDRVYKSYTNAARELVELPGDDELEGHVIVVDSNVQDDEEFTDIYIQCGEDKWGTSFIDWNSLIDLPVDDRISLEVSEILAHVLYDITFWGFTRKNVLEAGDSLSNSDKTDVVEVDIDEFLNPGDE